MSMPFNGTRLREARRFRKLSISKLSEKIGVTKQSISKYERGNAIPSAKVYSKLVFELGFPLSFFQMKDKYSTENLGTFYRSRMTSTQTEKAPSELKKKYLAILSNLFEKYVDFPPLGNNENYSTIPEIAAYQLREDWNLGQSPISNMVELLERHGFKLALSSSETDKVDAFGSEIKINNSIYYCILINQQNTTYFRQQFSLAHELGHWVLHSGKIHPQELDNTNYKIMEKEADQFASHFLLPSNPFKYDLNGYENDINKYVQLKLKWNVSLSSMIYKANNLGMLSPNEYISLQKKISYRNWRKLEPYDYDFSVNKPILLSQAFKLINEIEDLNGNTINKLLETNYGIQFPINLLAELIGISEEDLNNNRSNIVKFRNINKNN